MSLFHAIYGKGSTPTPSEVTFGEVQTLLWTNSSPTSNFSGKTVSLDLSTYDGVIVEYSTTVRETVGNFISRVKCAKNQSLACGGGFITNIGIARNIVKVTDDGVQFGDAYAASVDNQYLIPINIYGYKQYETGSIAGEAGSVSFSSDSDLTLDKNSYYLIVAVNNTTLTASKGNIIAKIDSSTVPSSNYYGQSAIVFTGDTGVVNFNMAGVAKKLSIGG